MKNLKSVVRWAKQNGEAKIIDRVLLKMLPKLLEKDEKLTSDMLDQQDEVWVEDVIYDQFVAIAEELVGARYE